MDENINHNIGLTFDFIRALLNDPKMMDHLPANFDLEFVEKNISESTFQNAENKVFVKVKNTFQILDKKLKSAVEDQRNLL